jgi:hypothetical protein
MKINKTLQIARKSLWISAFVLAHIACCGKTAPVSTTGQEVKVLFIGNSLTYSNGMPQLFDSLVKASGKEVYVDQATKSGKRLHQLLNDPTVIDKINEKPWDYVVLQSDDITAFPDLYDYEVSTVEAFKDIILQNNPASQIIYTMIWGLRDGVTVLELNGQYVYYSYEEYMNKIYEGTLFVADATNLMIAPVGWAWYSAVLDDPANKPLLFDSDGAHPSLHGSYLMACVMNAVIFLNSDSAIEYYSALPVEKAIYYQQKAVTTVFDSLELWNIFPVNTGINLDNQYHRQGFEINRIYPNPVNESAQIDFWLEKCSNVVLGIYDLSGEKIKSLNTKYLDKGSHSVEFSIENIPDGVYLVQLKCGNQIQSNKIVILK